MNRKLIAAAVSAAVVAPVASQADVVVYGNVTNAIVSEDDGTISKTDIETIGSRLGVKASSELGNGMTASGRYEWATISDTDAQALDTTRIAKVGVAGSFGSVEIGQQWSTFYSTIGSMVSPNYTVSVPLSGYFRTSNTIQYTNSFGPVNLGLDIRMDDDEGGRDGQGNGVGIGISFNPTSNLTVGLAYDSTDGEDNGTAPTNSDPGTHDEGDTDIVGVAVRASFGSFWASAGYQSSEKDGADAIAAVSGTHMGIPAVADIETDYYQLWIGGSLTEKTSWTLGYGESEKEEGATETNTDRIAFAVNHKIGGGLHLFLEHQDGTTEVTGNADVDEDKTALGMRINF